MKLGKFFTDTSSPGRCAPFVVGTALISLIFLVYHILTWPSFNSIVKAVVRWEHLFTDFVIYYYPMGEAVFKTGLPIEGYLYSPFIAILLAIFPPLGFNASLILWGTLQIVAVFLYILLFRRLVPAGLPIQLLFVALVFSSFPILLNFGGGQVSVFIIVAILGTLVLYQRGRQYTAASCLTLSVSFKFYPIIFLTPFAARRDLRFLLYAIASLGTLLLVVPGLFLGIENTLNFYRALLDSFRDADWVMANPHSHYFPHLALRWANAMGLDMQIHLPLLCWIGYGAAAVNMGLIFLVKQTRLRHENLWSFQIAFLTIPFILKTSWPHDFVFLPFTQAFLAWWLVENKKRGLTFFLLVTSIVLSNIIFFNLLDSFLGYSFYALLFWASMLLLITLYIELLPQVLKRIQKNPTP
jgi:hypothetical protein